MIKYCNKCKKYTLKNKCPSCGCNTIKKTPGRFKPDKDYSKQRLKVKGYL